MAERVLTARELNRALLARQLLLERSKLPLTRVLERMGGLQMQYAPSGYVGLWTRMRDFRRDRLTRALERRQVVQGTLMRVTIHLVSARDYRLFAKGVRRARLEWWQRVQRRELDGVDMEAAASLVRDRLADGPRSQNELTEALTSAGFPKVAWSGVGLWLDLVRVPPSGTWERRRADLYGLADGWVPAKSVSENEGIEHLVRRYLGAFGPAPVADIANWAGLNVTPVREIVESMRLRSFRDEEGAELVDLPRAPLPDGSTPAPARFLPTWDATLLVHARRTGIVPEEYRSILFTTKNPQSLSTFLVDGRVAGAWRYVDGRVEVEPFQPLPRTVRREVEEEAERLAAFHT